MTVNHGALPCYKRLHDGGGVAAGFGDGGVNVVAVAEGEDFHAGVGGPVGAFDDVAAFVGRTVVDVAAGAFAFFIDLVEGGIAADGAAGDAHADVFRDVVREEVAVCLRPGVHGGDVRRADGVAHAGAVVLVRREEEAAHGVGRRDPAEAEDDGVAVELEDEVRAVFGGDFGHEGELALHADAAIEVASTFVGGLPIGAARWRVREGVCGVVRDVDAEAVAGGLQAVQGGEAWAEAVRIAPEGVDDDGDFHREEV